MKAPWRCQVERTFLPFKIYKNWDIVKGFSHHGVITILCNVLGSVYVFSLGLSCKIFENLRRIETLAVHSTG